MTPNATDLHEMLATDQCDNTFLTCSPFMSQNYTQTTLILCLSRDSTCKNALFAFWALLLLSSNIFPIASAHFIFSQSQLQTISRPLNEWCSTPQPRGYFITSLCEACTRRSAYIWALSSLARISVFLHPSSLRSAFTFYTYICLNYNFSFCYFFFY